MQKGAWLTSDFVGKLVDGMQPKELTALDRTLGSPRCRSKIDAHTIVLTKKEYAVSWILAGILFRTVNRADCGVGGYRFVVGKISGPLSLIAFHPPLLER